MTDSQAQRVQDLRDDPTFDPVDDLRELESMWMRKLEVEGVTG